VGALVGIACGLVAAAPLAVLLGREEARLGHGMAAVAFAFLFVQGAVLAVRVLAPAEVLPFGTLAVTSFLVLVVAAVIRRELRR